MDAGFGSPHRDHHDHRKQSREDRRGNAHRRVPQRLCDQRNEQGPTGVHRTVPAALEVRDMRWDPVNEAAVKRRRTCDSTAGSGAMRQSGIEVASVLRMRADTRGWMTACPSVLGAQMRTAGEGLGSRGRWGRGSSALASSWQVYPLRSNAALILRLISSVVGSSNASVRSLRSANESRPTTSRGVVVTTPARRETITTRDARHDRRSVLTRAATKGPRPKSCTRLSDFASKRMAAAPRSGGPPLWDTRSW